MALEIFNGNLKGYAQVPDEKEIREALLKPYMKDLVKTSIDTVILKFSQKGREAVVVDGSTDYQADAIAIKVAIEFCLNIGATDFLFTEIFALFESKGLRPKLISNLEPFIISG